MTPLTGPLSGTAGAQAAGIELAVREINEAGGVMDAPIEVWHRDAGDGDPAKTAASFAQLLEKDVDVVIAPASAAVMDVLLPLAQEAGILVVAPATQATAPAGARVGAIVPDDDFVAGLRSSDPNLSELSYGAEAYELTTALALSAEFLNDDGAVSLSWALSHVQGPGITCTSFAARSLPSAEVAALVLVVPRLIASTRSTGSAISVRKAIGAMPNWLPASIALLPPRVDIGTIAFSVRAGNSPLRYTCRCGCAPLSARYTYASRPGLGMIVATGLQSPISSVSRT
jgi:hypothetical protein